MTKGYYYLALPYHGTDEQKSHRKKISLDIAVEFLRQDLHVFAPVIYVNQIADQINFASSDERREKVMPLLLNFLSLSKGLVLVTLEGWTTSKGIQQELEYCFKHNIPVYKLEPNELYTDISSKLTQPLQQQSLSEISQDFQRASL